MVSTNEQLETEIQSLRNPNDESSVKLGSSLSSQIAKLKEENDLLREKNTNFQGQLTKVNENISRLTEENSQLKAQLNAR